MLHNLTHTDAAYSPIFSPDSTILVTSTHALAKGGLRHEIFWFWDVKTGKSLSVYDRGDVEEGSSPMAFSPDGKKLACGTDRGTVKLVDIHDLKNIKIIYEKTDLMSYYSIRSMSFSPNGTYLAVAALENPFIIIDVSTGKEVFRNKGIQHAYQIAFSPDGKTLTIAGKLWKKDNHKLTVRLFNIDSWKMTGDFRDHDATDGLGFTSDGSSLVFIGEPNVEVYNIRTKRVIKSITFKYLLSATSIAPDGKSIAIGYLLGNTIQIHSIGAKGK